MTKIDKIRNSSIVILLLAHLCFFSNSNGVLADGNIGCLFAESLCIENKEWCHDDYAFGKCLPQYGLQPEELIREPLNEEESALLATMLEDLQGAGLDWSHPFVQCRMQEALYSVRHERPIPNSLCADLAPDPENFEPQSPLAFVRFVPPNDDFADEVYYPPGDKRTYEDEITTINEKSDKYIPELNEIENAIAMTLGEEEIEANRRKNLKNRIELEQMLAEYEPGNLQPPIYHKSGVLENNERSVPYIFPVLNEMNNEKFEYLNNLFKDNEQNEKIMRLLKEYQQTKKNEHPEIEHPKTLFREVSRNQHIPLESSFHETNELPNDLFNEQNKHNIHIRIGTGDMYTNNDANKKHYERNNFPPSESGVYTEGGLIYVPESEERKNQSKETRNLLRDIMGFTRHERLDVKKPGPPASPPVDTHFTKESDKHAQTKEVLPANLLGDDGRKIKKVLNSHSEDEDHAPHSVDREYTHVIFKNPIDSWTTGERVVNAIGEMLNLKLTHPRVDRHEVSFRVEPNPEKKTAADVAKFINDTRFKNNLSRRLGIIVIRAGVGDKVSDTKENDSVSSEKVDQAKEGSNMTHVIAYMFAGAGAAAVIVVILTLMLIKKHDKKRDKLGGLQSYQIVGNESCTKDYQELCRARMAGKGNSGDSTSGRIASLSKENEGRPPSSRSSTSSWSEEPALTNMDISTGHMVLSYMEDHLRNKGRLQREWEALCRYEAEPSARDAALQPQCASLNRANSPLPFDHSRVMLNHLTNAEGMDYINASTITDHDPRAPAYVAAQGPLPTTLAHFWQMIWEQGAVVIVALCRLQENGESACARYWPEEGSETYHIYEVHLVSEHIWCDDYLVRSFYLKNLKTGETRTVTQFHFSSWPQGSVPASAKALLEFRRKVNKSYRGRSCPIVVHSSNGAGRTGAYILLDLVLARMNKGAREIDIAATLEHLRDQRAGLVATRQQFEFVLMAVAEEVHAILKALPANTSNEKRELDKDKEKEKEPSKGKNEDENVKTTKANEK